jgi:Spy/CpxP family protein refolding chaperone
MRTFGKMILASGLVVLMVAPAMAQRPGRGGFGGFGGGGGAMLVANKGVQQELKVDDEQAEKLNALAQELGEKQREQFQRLQDVPQDERRDKMQEISQAMNADLRKSLDKVLKPEQIKRFEQIQLQQAGLSAFATPRVQEELKLSDEQKSKLREINEEQSQAMRSAFQGAQDDREGAMRKIADLRKQSNEKALAVLTDDQKKTWKDMTGEPFEVRFEFRRPNNQ